MKREFTVGEIARILNVARSTVVYWIKDGRISAYQTPGGNNRVTRDNLVRFMNSFNIPLDYIEGYITKRILIVDCEPELLKLTMGLLKKEEDYDVTSASNWFEAGVLAREYRPHIIILDIHSEAQNGSEVCKTLKDSSELKKIKVIGISDTLDKNEKEMKKLGFAGFFKKPVNLAELKDKIAELV